MTGHGPGAAPPRRLGQLAEPRRAQQSAGAAPTAIIATEAHRRSHQASQRPPRMPITRNIFMATLLIETAKIVGMIL